MKFSEKLANLRKTKGWSQEEFAQKINVTRQTVSKWELDQTVPDLNKLIEMSKLFEISVDELANGVETSNSENTYKESSIEKHNKKIALIILVVGMIISFAFCGIGWIRQIQAKKTDEKAYENAYLTSQTNVENAKKRYDEIIEEKKTLEEQIGSLETVISDMQKEKQNIFKEGGFNDSYYAKEKEITEKQSELTNLRKQYSNLEMEAFKLNNADYTVYYNKVEPIKYMIFYYIGGGIAGIAILISLIYFLATRRK